MLESGWYRLSEDMKNPRPTRLGNWINGYILWPTGTVVKLCMFNELSRGRICFMDGSYVQCSGRDSDSDAWTQGNDILRVLEPKPWTLGTVLKDEAMNPAILLAYMLETGTLSLPYIQTCCRLIQEQEDGVQAKMLRDHDVGTIQ